jgi:hypothetical protein
MRLERATVLAAAVTMLVAPLLYAQGQGAQAPAAGDGSQKVAGGGISAPGWMGKIDANEEKAGLTLNDAKLAQQGNVLHVTTGPAVTYWNPKNVAAGNYTVKATFHEPKYMNLNNHAHPYGIMVAGNDLGTPTGSYLYCAAYGDGRFIVRGFGPDPFQTGGGRRGEAAPSVNKAAGRGSPVTQEIAVTVKADSVECSINGAVVGTYPKADVVGAGKLKSTDGVYGIRFAHNTEGTVTGLTMTKN